MNNGSPTHALLVFSLGFAWTAPGCMGGSLPDDDDVAPDGPTRFAGHLYDEDTGADLPDCEVGVTRSQAVRSDEAGRFSIDVEREAVVNVRCEGGLVRSFQLPDVAAVDWEINIDFWGAEVASTDCLLDLEADLTGLGLDPGDGSTEIRVLRADGSARSFTRAACRAVPGT